MTTFAVPLLLALHFFPSAQLRSVIDRTGSPSCAAREAATEDLARMVAADPSLLMRLWWGLEHRQPEVRWRTSIVIRRAAPCGKCKGYPRQYSVDYRGATIEWNCAACGVTGIDFNKVSWVRRGE